jgi:hypothetical protein
MHLYVRGVGFATFYDFDIRFWNCSDSVVYFGIIRKLTRCVPHVEQELLTLSDHLSSPPVFSGDSCCSIVSFLCSVLYIVVCPLFLLTLCCLSFSDLRLLITTLVSSNFSYS